MTEARRGYLLGTTLVLATALLCLSYVAVVTFSVPERWEIPDGYRGWVVLTVEDPRCPAPPWRGLTRVVVFDQAGRACTSRPPMRGSRNVTRVYVAADGRRTTLRYEGPDPAAVQAWRGGTGGGSEYPYPYEYFFIGTQAEAERANPIDGRP